MGNDGPLCSNLMWPQANLALDTAQGVQSEQESSGCVLVDPWNSRTAPCKA